MLKEVKNRLKEQNIEIEIDNSVKELIAEKGTDSAYGARPLRRAIQNLLEDKLAESILDNKLKPNSKAKVIAKNGEIVVE